MTRDGAHLDVVDEAIHVLSKGDPDRQSRELLSLLYGISGLTFHDQTDKDWLDRRFAMLEDLLEDSWTFRRLRERAEEKGIAIGKQIGEQKGIAIGEQKGIAIGEQKGIAIGEQKGEQIGEQRGMLKPLRYFVKRRFPMLLPLVEEFSQKTFTEDVLNTALFQIAQAQTEAEARHHLLAALHSNS
ncbi:hypothetical protein [Dictyobacter arantiisoli]|uniref:Uncharacterized protein n=1 Tax=Dictyobacter arantiisoli TaxID=2014874 RepID=A0A5A5TH63_9CHLR|nr:hypothetical protein [Dictyobacter arantiisoli]GCF10304.1 hypothetical protein KDI_38680 [Dictyobacter arantiisoli]